VYGVSAACRFVSIDAAQASLLFMDRFLNTLLSKGLALNMVLIVEVY